MAAEAVTATEMVITAKPLTDEQRIEVNRFARIERARWAAKDKDILAWGKNLFPDKFPLPFCRPLHDYLVEIRGLPFTATKAPRYHSKTTIKGFLIPMFQAIYEPDTFVHYLHVQATDKKANAVNRSIRYEFEENQELLQLCGDLIGDRWTDEQFVLRNGVCFTAVSAGQSIRGINYRNRRPDYIMPDDLYNEDDIYNPEAVEKKNDWFWSTLYPARAQGRRTSVQVIGTATNKLDLLNKLESVPWVKSRTFKAIVGDWKNREVLWPEKNTFDQLMNDMAVMTTSIFMREMQNEERDDATSIVKAAWIKEYDPGILVPAGKFEYVGCELGVDPSIGQKEENDFTGMALIYKFRYTDAKGFVYYIQKLWNEHWTLDERVNKIQEIQDAQPADRKITLCHIEGIAGFKDFVAEAKRRTNVPIREVDKVPDKLANLENKAWYFETSKIFLNQNIDAKLKDNWKYQMTTNHPRYDDMRDGTLLVLPSPIMKPDAMAYAD
jgi:hypothetical protein